MRTRSHDQRSSRAAAHGSKSKQVLVALTLLAGGINAACAGADAQTASSGTSDVAFSPSGNGAGVAQGGAQDFGAFREVLDQAQLPTAELLDDVGFFNEHKIELPAPNCGEPICLHAQLGVMGNMIDGANCTMLFIGMNTLLDAEAPRRPLNLALALDVSGSMAGPPLDNLIIGLRMMLPHLGTQDRISIVTFSDGADVVVSGASAAIATDGTADWSALEPAISGLQAKGGTNIYAGLGEAYWELERHAADGYENRVVLLSDGEATVGFAEPSRLLTLAREYAELGLSLSTIGIGGSFDSELLRLLSLEGAGSYYFLDDPSALAEVFTEEVQTSLVPLAKDAKLTVEVAEGYRARAAFGTNDAVVRSRVVEIDMPVLQIAQRKSVDDHELGRRGGGGVIIVELTPDPDADVESGEHAVGSVSLSYSTPKQGGMTRVEDRREILSPLSPGETPRRGYFEGSSVEKSFVMLNIYAGMQVALEQLRIGDSSAALSALTSLESAVQGWLEDNPDADIESDLETLRTLIALIAEQAPEVEVQSVAPPIWGYD